MTIPRDMAEYRGIHLVDNEGRQTYDLVESTKGEQGIKCRNCGMVSFHPDDIKYKYCGNCHAFHTEAK